MLLGFAALSASASLGGAEVGAAVADASAADVRARVIERARHLASREFIPPPADLREELRNLNYDQYHQIQFKNERSFWRGDPGGFEIQGFHRGFLFPDPVTIYLVENGQFLRLPYDPALFGFGMLDHLQPATFGDIGYSGLRVLSRLAEPAASREFLVFQGASYFRARAPGLTYGLSARGLAVATAAASGEEFPRFSEFYVERPVPGEGRIFIHGILDSPSVSGAFTFTVEPGRDTRMKVEATLFPRVDLDHIGLAPLTSMYWFGPLERPVVDDFRGRVHDSDGLAVRSESDEWIWRPLANPAALQISSFNVGRVRGFGLGQRVRELRDFHDLHARYHLRPSLWIAPIGPWPAGAVELVEIPTRSEFNDNIVAYWRPANVVPAGKPLEYAYEMSWGQFLQEGFGLLRTRDSMSGAHGRWSRRFVIDFAGAGSGLQLAEFAGFEADVSTSSGRVDGKAMRPHPDGGVRLTFLLTPEGPTAELRAVLRQGSRPISETWLYRWTEG